MKEHNFEAYNVHNLVNLGCFFFSEFQLWQLNKLFFRSRPNHHHSVDFWLNSTMSSKPTKITVFFVTYFFPVLSVFIIIINAA